MKIPRVQVQRIKYLYSILYCKLLDDAFIRCKWCIFLWKLCKLWKAALNLAYPNLFGRFLDLLWCSIKSHSNCLVNTGIKTVKLGWILRIFRILVIKIQKNHNKAEFWHFSMNLKYREIYPRFDFSDFFRKLAQTWSS